MRAALLSLLFVNTTIMAAEDFSYCTACHGANGNGNYAIRAPKIAGMEPWYIRRQLEAFRTQRRGAHADDLAGHEMRPIGVRVDQEAEITRALAHVASFVPKPPAHTITGDVESGRRLFAPCAACHGQRGEGNQALGAPALALRNDWYLLTQLKNFSNGIRGADPSDTYGAQMRAAVVPLEREQDMQDVVAFINTLQ